MERGVPLDNLHPQWEEAVMRVRAGFQRAKSADMNSVSS